MAVVPAAPSRAAPRPMQAAWWRYVEKAHAHEVTAEWREPEGALRVRETAREAPGDELRLDVPVEQPWEARLAVWLLEARLAQLGSYWRSLSLAPAWTTLARPAGAPAADPRENAVLDRARAPLLHHYHEARGGGDTLLAALRRDEAGRYVVLRASLDVPSLEIGRIDVLHARLPTTLARSLVMREEIALAQTGAPKLVTREDYERAFGSGGERRASKLVDEVVARVRGGQLERPIARPEGGDVYEEFLVTLQDPRLLALHRRFLRQGEEDTLLDAGPVAIRKAVSAKRAEAEHDERHLLTILEASLLARERMRSGTLVRTDAEVRALARLAYYL